MTIISIKQAYPGHAMRAAHGALGGTAGYHGRFVMVVDDDIDPFNLHDVMWALATRCDPERAGNEHLSQDLELQDRSAFAGGRKKKPPIIPVRWRLSTHVSLTIGSMSSRARRKSVKNC